MLFIDLHLTSVSGPVGPVTPLSVDPCRKKERQSRPYAGPFLGRNKDTIKPLFTKGPRIRISRR